MELSTIFSALGFVFGVVGAIAYLIEVRRRLLLIREEREAYREQIAQNTLILKDLVKSIKEDQRLHREMLKYIVRKAIHGSDDQAGAFEGEGEEGAVRSDH